jgi:hypothetical protein
MIIIEFSRKDGVYPAARKTVIFDRSFKYDGISMLK